MKQTFIQSKLLLSVVIFLITFFSHKTLAQPTAFDCSAGLSYILTNTNPGTGNITSLYSYNLTTGANTLIKANLLPATPANQRFYNGFGYNTVDNRLYGYRYNTSQVVRVGANGDIELLTMTGTVSTGNYAAGDVSPDGILYLFGSDRFVSVNLNSTASNYLVATQKLSYTAAINDFAFSPVDGKIYGVTSDASRRLFRFDPGTNVMTILGPVGGLSAETDNSFGTAFMDNAGNLYVGNNVSGNIFRIATPHLITAPSTTITSTLYSDGLAGRTPGDGARCSSAIILPGANDDQACSPASSTTPVSIGVVSNDSPGTYPLSNSSVRLINASNQRVTSVTVTQGTFSVSTTTGLVQFQPLPGFTTGTASVTYSIADNLGNLSAPATITVTICPPPTATNDQITGITPGQPGVIPTINTNDTSPTGTTLVVPTINLIVPSIPGSTSEDTDGDGDADRIVVPGQGVWKVDASGNVTFTPEPGFLTNPTPITYTIKNSTGAVSNAATLTVTYLPLATVSGNVFVDANGLNDLTVNGNPYTTPGLYAFLVSGTGKIISSQEVSASGAFSFANVLYGNYTVQLSNIAGAAGTDAPLLATFPAGDWLPTGEHVGADAGNDVTANGSTVITVTGNLTNVNFGINQAPTAVPVDDMIPMPRPGDVYVFKPLSGSDPQDGEYAHFIPSTDPAAPNPTIRILGSTFQFEAPGAASPSVVLTYGSTVLSTTSDNAIIPNFDFTQLSAILNGTGYTGFQFEYVVIDAAGVSSVPAIYKVHWSNPLPVKLVSFLAKREGQNVQLSWATTEESNSDRFEIERSNNAKSWVKIGVKKAAGESSVLNRYNFVDATPIKGTNYYRLKMVDLDYSFAYSSIVSAVNEAAGALVFAPNPSRDFVTISGLAVGEKIEIMNSAGVKVSTMISSGSSFTFDVSKLQSGIYIVLVTNPAGDVTTHRIVKE